MRKAGERLEAVVFLKGLFQEVFNVSNQYINCPHVYIYIHNSKDCHKKARQDSVRKVHTAET